MDISSLLAARFQSVTTYGVNTIQQILQSDLDAHNTLMMEMISELCEPTTDRQRIYGSSATGEMVEVDEYGAAPTQKAVTGATVGFPLRQFQYNIGWTRKWMENHTPAEMAAQVIAAETAHRKAVAKQIKKAIYNDTNVTFTDFLVDKVSLSVKRFINADSAAIPDGPNGETFTASSHSHYNANATLTAAALLDNVNDVVEHGHGNRVHLAISRTDETAVKALSGFTAYIDPRLVYRVTDTPAQALDISRLDNRAIGIFGAAEVWVKPWAIASYPFAWDAGDPQKPLCYRQRNGTAATSLRIAAEFDSFPLHAQFLEDEFGVGVWTRTNGAVLYTASGTWANPTIS
jgi:hypothetical protein